MIDKRLHGLFILGLMLSTALISGCSGQEKGCVSLPVDAGTVASSTSAAVSAPQKPELEYRLETETYCNPDGTVN